MFCYQNLAHLKMDNLLKRIKNRYDVKSEILSVGSENITIAMVKDVDRLLDEMLVEENLISSIPYWAELWESTIALSRYIWENVDMEEEPVLELGCGLGLTGIAAAKKGAKVLLTDYEDGALLFASYNAMVNGCKNVEFRNMDWRYPNLSERKFKYILAADVVYEETSWKPIIDILEKNLQHPGEAIISEPNRLNALGFFELLQGQGFGYTKTPMEVSQGGRTITITIYRIPALSLKAT